MSSRRPRVPRSTARPAETAAETPRDADTAAAPAESSAVATAERTGTERHPVGGHSAKVIPLDQSARPERPASVRQVPGQPKPERPAPARLSPEQRRAAERRDLLERSVRPAPTGASSASGQRGHRPAGRRHGPSAGQQRPGSRSGSATRHAQPALRAPRTTAAPSSSSSSSSAAPRTGTARTPSAPRAAAPTVQPIPARSFSGRGVALLLVALIAAILVAPTLRVYLNQQSEITAVREDIAAQQELEQDLNAQISRWDDPAYVQQQARERLNLVMPGEKKYMVVGQEPEAAEDEPAGPANTVPVNPDVPWTDRMWDSVVQSAQH